MTHLHRLIFIKSMKDYYNKMYESDKLHLCRTIESLSS